MGLYGMVTLKIDEGKHYFNDKDLQRRPRWIHFQACVSFVGFCLVDAANILRTVGLASLNRV